MKARELMSPAEAVGEDARVADAVRVMLESGQEGVPVTRPDGTICGLIEERDFVPRLHALPFSETELPSMFGRWVSPATALEDMERAGGTPARQAMRRDFASVPEEAPVSEVMALLEAGDKELVAVLRDGVPVGLIGPRQLLTLVGRAP
jgi:CBS domain-containing protein